MRFGVVLFTSDRGIRPAAAARAAEAAGFDSFYVPEHTHIPVRRAAAHPRTGGAELPDDRYLRTLDPWVALAMAAAVTERITLGTSVALPVEHDPIALAKTIASLDHLSDGRVVLGVGTGWNTDELADHGVPPGKRRAMLREFLDVMQQLWSADEASYDGEFVSLAPSWALPKPVQQPRVPILLGAAGTDKNIAWMTRATDGWITTPGEQDVAGRLRRLRKAWTEACREGTPRVVVLDGKPKPDTIARWRELEVSEVVYGLPDREESEVVDYIEKIGAAVSGSR